MSVIDFHSHILPGIDDGARNLETSLAMLRQVSSQRVDYMIATPHFYASHDRIDAFLNRREDAYNSLKEAVHKESLSDVPQILTGSEVAYRRSDDTEYTSPAAGDAICAMDLAEYS